jgi:hypothetical protein
MNKLLTPKNLLIASGIVSMTLGTLFYIVPSMIAKDTFPEELLTNEGLRIAELMQEALGTFLIAMGTLLFSLRNVDKKSARKAIIGLGFASTAIFIGGILHLLKNDVHPPIPGIIAAGVILLLSVVVVAQEH